MDPRLIDDLETPTFPVALRGYDREAVDAFLGEVATRIERASRSAEVAPQRDQVAAELRRISQDLRVSVVENTRIEPVAEDAEADELDPATGETEADEDDLGYELPELEPPAEVSAGGRFRPRGDADPAEL